MNYEILLRLEGLDIPAEEIGASVERAARGANELTGLSIKATVISVRELESA